MAERVSSIAELAKRGDLRNLEDRFLDEIESLNPDQGELMTALTALSKQGQPARAAELAWAWLSTYKDKSGPAQALALACDLLVICGESEDLRQEVLSLYRSVYADRPEIETLISVSGLAGGRSPRRAVRTIELALKLREGDYLVHRADDHVVRITKVDVEQLSYTVRNSKLEETHDADELALAYDAVDANDFRVLSQLRPDALKQLLESDPVGLIIGILQSRHGQIDSDHLEAMLTSAIIPAERWKDWWSKAKTSLKRSPNVVVEGRNPVILTYHAQGQTLEDEILPQWVKCETAVQRLAVVESYLREGKARSTGTRPELVARMHKELHQRVEVSRKGSPSHALAEALVIERLARAGVLAANAARPAGDILRASGKATALLNGLSDYRLYEPAVDLLREVHPDAWVDHYLRLLPTAPTEVCGMMAEALCEAGRLESLREVVREVVADFNGKLGAVCWLWRGPGIPELEPIPRQELLPRLLDYLGELTRADRPDPDLLREARTRIRAALSANDYAHYREVIETMDSGLASTIHRTVDRSEGLGQVVQAGLLRIISDGHPRLFVKARVDPWLDDNVIFCTQEGMQKREGELNHLLLVKIPENARAIGEAAARGDLSENSEYKFALEERDLLQARVRGIRQEMSRARLITANDVSTDAVNVGTRVQLASGDGQHRQAMTILGPWEADLDKRIYNYRAPMCMKLKGLTIGEAVALELDGHQGEYRIETIENALERRA